jgi:hypothetical protein
LTEIEGLFDGEVTGEYSLRTLTGIGHPKQSPLLIEKNSLEGYGIGSGDFEEDYEPKQI